MNRRCATVAAVVGFAALVYGPSAALAQTAPSLGTAQTFAVLGGSTVTNTGSSVITGDLGVSPGSAVTGFFAVDGGPGTVNGTIYRGPLSAAAPAQRDAALAFLALSQPCTVTFPAGDTVLGGRTLNPGVYCSPS